MTDQVTERALKIAKERHGWNQRQFADEIGVDKQHITNWLSRGMPARQHSNVAGKLMISVEELLTGKSSGMPDIIGKNFVGEAKATYHGHRMSPETARFAAEWEKLRSPLKAQIQALIETLVGEQVREDRKPPRAPPAPSDKKRPNA